MLHVMIPARWHACTLICNFMRRRIYSIDVNDETKDDSRLGNFAKTRKYHFFLMVYFSMLTIKCTNLSSGRSRCVTRLDVSYRFSKRNDKTKFSTSVAKALVHFWAPPLEHLCYLQFSCTLR